MAFSMITSKFMRIALMTAVTIMNLILVILMLLSVLMGNGGRFEIALVLLTVLASFLPAVYWIHVYYFRGDYAVIRSLTINLLLFLLGLVSMVIILVRNSMEGGDALKKDFALLDHSTGVVKASIALTVLIVICSFASTLVSYLEWRSVLNTEVTFTMEEQPQLRAQQKRASFFSTKIGTPPMRVVKTTVIQHITSPTASKASKGYSLA